jgi:hypothetical protein
MNKLRIITFLSLSLIVTCKLTICMEGEAFRMKKLSLGSEDEKDTEFNDEVEGGRVYTEELEEMTLINFAIPTREGDKPGKILLPTSMLKQAAQDLLEMAQDKTELLPDIPAQNLARVDLGELFRRRFALEPDSLSLLSKPEECNGYIHEFAGVHRIIVESINQEGQPQRVLDYLLVNQFPDTDIFERHVAILRRKQLKKEQAARKELQENNE